MDRMPSSAAVANSKLCLTCPWKKIAYLNQWPVQSVLGLPGSWWRELGFKLPKFSTSSAVLGPAASFYDLNWTRSSSSKVRFFLHFQSTLWYTSKNIQTWYSWQGQFKEKICTNCHKANKIMALRCKLESFKAEELESDAQQACSRAEILAACTEGKANWLVQREVSYTRTKTCQKQSSKIWVPHGANFVNQPFCKSLSLRLLSAHPQISNGQRWSILKISHSTISLSKDCPWYIYWSTSPSKIPI